MWHGKSDIIRCSVLTATNMKMTVFWDVAPCSLVEINRRFGDAYCHIIVLMMEAVSTSETSVKLYQTTRRNISEDSLHHQGDDEVVSTSERSSFLPTYPAQHPRRQSSSSGRVIRNSKDWLIHSIIADLCTRLRYIPLSALQTDPRRGLYCTRFFKYLFAQRPLPSPDNTEKRR
jgi:hypothetical protein